MSKLNLLLLAVIAFNTIRYLIYTIGRSASIYDVAMLIVNIAALVIGLIYISHNRGNISVLRKVNTPDNKKH